jgi:hypothetical protein
VRNKIKLSLVAHTLILALRRLGGRNVGFEANLGYIVRLGLKKKAKQKQTTKKGEGNLIRP